MRMFCYCIHPEEAYWTKICPGIEKLEDITPQFWENRMEQINNFENILLKKRNHCNEILLTWVRGASANVCCEDWRRGTSLEILTRIWKSEHWRIYAYYQGGEWNGYQKMRLVHNSSDDKDMATYCSQNYLGRNAETYGYQRTKLDNKVKANFRCIKICWRKKDLWLIYCY
jgi:hypothetical protein